VLEQEQQKEEESPTKWWRYWPSIDAGPIVVRVPSIVIVVVVVEEEEMQTWHGRFVSC
jgi:hypothetical protein